ncbi:hypothetical protein QEG73_05410 [Chitinophagaceae bacterium 26-R-25]|nr:hypothetical protein [Chitinophagaceae bacterium 26-R-25]
MIEKKILDVLAGLILVGLPLIIGYSIYKDRSMSKSFKQRDKTVITLAHFESGDAGYKGSVKLKIWYMVDNKRKDYESTEFNLKFSIIRRLVGKTIPIVYLKDDPGKNTLLLSEYAFKYVNLPFPDSLNWLKEYKSW